MLLETVLDEQDAAILSERYGAFLANEEPREGDFVRFADGVERRISHVWPEDWSDGGRLPTIQTSDGGSWYFGNGYCSFSGSLHLGVPRSSLTLTDETKIGSAWFFHHDHHRASNSVDVQLPFRVYLCSEAATA